MRYCQSCQEREGREHITVIVDAFGPETTERLYAQFWLCAECVTVLQRLFVRDAGIKGRVARTLTRPQEGRAG